MVQELDGTPNKSRDIHKIDYWNKLRSILGRLGANAILGVSLAILKAGAAEKVLVNIKKWLSLIV